jgi:prolyl-tRNA synthetase
VIVIVGRDAVDGFVELWDRRTGEKEKVAVSDVVSSIAALV